MDHLKRPVTIVLLFAVMFSACSPARRAARQAKAQEKNLPEITVSVNDAINQYRASTPILWDIIHTRVALSFNWAEKTADGQAWIDIQPFAKSRKILTLDAKSMQIERVEQIVGEQRKAIPHTYNDDKVTLTLDREYKPNEKLKIYIKYKALPYSKVTGGSAAITDDRGLYFINTDGEIPNKPHQIWTQGETEANSHWMPTIDKPNERMTVQIELTVPEKMQTLSNGVKLSSEPAAGEYMKTDIWKMDKPIQVYAAMFAIGKFAIVKDKWRDKEVNYYVEREYEPYAKKMFNNTPEMMEYFSTITGVDYPWQKYDQVVVRDYVSGAMENTTASLYGEFMNQNFREIADNNFEDIVAHELFHQWFGDYVTMESWSNLTVSESFANYGEQLWRKHKYGKESADRLAYNDLNKYLNSKTYSPLVRFNYNDKEDMFDRISYEKGGAILNYLHGLIGDDAFFKAMNIYLTKNALSSTEATHWRLAVEEATGEDWNWFFNQFYLRGSHPHLEISYTYDDVKQELVVSVSQPNDKGASYQLPLKSAVIYGNEQSVVDWNIVKNVEEYKYPYKNGIKPVIIPDMEHWLPGTIAENKTSEHWLVQFQNTKNYISKRKAINEAVKNIGDDVAKQLIDKALSDASPLIKEHTLSAITKLTGDVYANRWKSTVEYLAAEDADRHVRANAFTMLGKWKVQSSKNAMLAALCDSSYAVAGAALEALYKIAPDSAYARARVVLEQDPKTGLQTAAESIIAQKGVPTDIAYFEGMAPHVYGSRKLALSSILSAYLSVVKDETVFERGVSLMADMAKNESIKSYRKYVTFTLIYLGNQFKKGGLENEVRLNKIKKYAEQLTASEPDEENKVEYRKLINEVLNSKSK